MFWMRFQSTATTPDSSFPASATCERLFCIFLPKCNHLTIGSFEKMFYMQFTLDVYFVLAMLYLLQFCTFDKQSEIFECCV